jgi:hypothetical protein
MAPFNQPTTADLAIAQQIVDSEQVISVYTAIEWDEMDPAGQTWLAAIVREAAHKAGGRASRQVVVSMDAQIKWSVRTFFRATRNHAGGVVLGFAPTFLAIGVELITGDTRGVAFMVGPFWLGFAISEFDRDAS